MKLAFPSNKQLLVIGSYNFDLISTTKMLPRPGETVIGSQFFTSHGGKGANQAVAAARLGQKTIFFAKLGADNYGEQAIDFLGKEGIDTQYIQKLNKSPTGTAQILVDEKGENVIVVSPGSNDQLTIQDETKYEELILNSDMVLIQFEIRMETVKSIIKIAKKYNKTVIVNPAPAKYLKVEDFKQISYLVPNVNELRILANKDKLDSLEEIKAAGADLIKKGVKHLVITLGKNGTLYMSEDKEMFIKPLKVPMLDSTGAGDCFCGAFAHYLVNEFQLKEALINASAAAALSVMKRGTTPSYPTRKELESFIEENATLQDESYVWDKK